MEWLLGGIAGVGIAGLASLALYIIKFARDNRGDLKALVALQKELSKAHNYVAELQRSIDERGKAIDDLQKELDRAKASLHFARSALEAATKKLVGCGDASGAVDDLNRTLRRLSELSDVPIAAAPSGDNS